MAGDDPGDDHRGIPLAEHLVCQCHRRGNRGDPVQAVERRKDPQTDYVEMREGQRHQRQSAQPVIPEQQDPRIIGGRSGTGDRGPHQVEHPHRGQQACGTYRGDAVIDAERDQMRRHKAVGRKPADRERSEQQPEIQRTSHRGSARRSRSRTGCPSAAAAPRPHPTRTRRSRSQAGFQGNISTTSGISARIVPATTSGTTCQLWETTRLASNGRKINCPEALLAVSSPTTSPRRCTNHRLAIAVASPIMPAPKPVRPAVPR